MSACAVLLLLVCGCQTRQAAGPGPVSAPLADDSGELRAEAQYRRGLDPACYPMIEVFLANQTPKPVEWRRAILNGTEVRCLTNGVVWVQFYPSEKAAPGQTRLLQISLVDNPRTPQVIEAETADGRLAGTRLPSFMWPVCRVSNITFSWDFRKMFVGYEAFTPAEMQRLGLAPTKVEVNGTDLTKDVRLFDVPRNDEQGMFAVALPSPVRQGQPVHVRLTLREDMTTQCVIRAHKGIFLDAFGVAETDYRLRKQLGLDRRPSARLYNCDPACTDLDLGFKYGASAPDILDARKTWWAEHDDRLGYVALCTGATGHCSYSIYGQIMDAVNVNPYKLHWTDIPQFIEWEEHNFRWGRRVAGPRPWYWFPETFEVRQRLLEPEELRLLTYSALAHGCKGVNYYTYQEQTLAGFGKSPRLLAEIKKLNREIKRLERILAPAIPIMPDAPGPSENGVRVWPLWVGDGGLLIIARNLDYTTDREPNALCAKPRFKRTPKPKVRITVKKRAWLGGPAPSPGRGWLRGVDLLSGRSVRCEVDADRLWFDTSLDLVAVVFIPR